MKKKDHYSLRGPVQFCHMILRERIRPGDRVVDATCGNGFDTLLLAALVGSGGKVWSFDIDENALRDARERLREASLENIAELVLDGHERIAHHVREPLRAVVFNLGYLPGGDGVTVTCPETTIAALEESVVLILPGGFILLAVYTGHPGGMEEGHSVEAWASALPSPQFNVWRCALLNRRSDAPFLLLIEKAF